MVETRSSTAKRKKALPSKGAGTTVDGTVVVPPPYYIAIACPDYFTVKMNYNDVYFMHITGENSRANQRWRINSLFDFDVTNTGHQPLFRDKWATIYEYYRVLNVEYKIYMGNTIGPAIDATTPIFTNDPLFGHLIATLAFSTNTGDFTSLDYAGATEYKYAQNRILEPVNGGNNKSSTVWSGNVQSEQYDVDIVDDASDTVWTAMGANPAVPRYMDVSFTAAAGWPNPGAIFGNISFDATAIVWAEFVLTVQMRQNPVVDRSANS